MLIKSSSKEIDQSSIRFLSGFVQNRANIADDSFAIGI